MNELEKAARQALEALEEAHWKTEHKQDRAKRAEAITALRQALEQPAQQEPAAYEVRAFGATRIFIKRADVADEKAAQLERQFGSEAEVTVLPLYTRPQARAPLTDEQVKDAPRGLIDIGNVLRGEGK